MLFLHRNAVGGLFQMFPHYISETHDQ